MWNFNLFYRIHSFICAWSCHLNRSWCSCSRWCSKTCQKPDMCTVCLSSNHCEEHEADWLLTHARLHPCWCQRLHSVQVEEAIESGGWSPIQCTRVSVVLTPHCGLERVPLMGQLDEISIKVQWRHSLHTSNVWNLQEMSSSPKILPVGVDWTELEKPWFTLQLNFASFFQWIEGTVKVLLIKPTSAASGMWTKCFSEMLLLLSWKVMYRSVEEKRVTRHSSTALFPFRNSLRDLLISTCGAGAADSGSERQKTP